jgi:hypothetical protein
MNETYRIWEEFQMEGDICHIHLFQQRFASLLKNAYIEWVGTSSEVHVFVPPGSEHDWIEVFRKEQAVEEVGRVHPLATFPSVESATKIKTAIPQAPAVASPRQSPTTAPASPEPSQPRKPLATHIQKPTEISVKSKLPSTSTITDFVDKFYLSHHPRITLIKADRDQFGEYFEILVEHLKGAITNPPYWEKLRYSIPIYMADKDTMKIRCVLDGQFAPGIGAEVPSADAFLDMEPRYTGAMQDHVGRFVQALETYMVVKLK